MVVSVNNIDFVLVWRPQNHVKFFECQTCLALVMILEDDHKTLQGHAEWHGNQAQAIEFAGRNAYMFDLLA